MRPEDVPAELVEKAAMAKYADDPYRLNAGNPYDLPSGDPWPWEHLDFSDVQEIREETRHALAAALPEYGAQVLEEAAKEGVRGFDLTPTTMSLGTDQGWWYRYLQRLDEAWRGRLRQRAARLRAATTEEPSPPAHVGGRVNAEDCPACSPAIDPPPYPWICPGPTTTEEPTT